VVWGTSVLVSALAAGLATRNDLGVVQVEATLEAALGALEDDPAHAVVCDLASVPAAWVLSLLEMHPRLTVVIVDAKADRGMALTCRPCSMRTLDDLLAAVTEGAGAGRC